MIEIDHNFWARKIISFLIKHIKEFSGGKKYITYGALAKTIGYPEPHIGNLFSSNIGKTLGVMGHLFDNITVAGQKIPMIQSLVVNQSKKLPSDGLKEFSSIYPNLSTQKKRDFVNSEYRDIFDFGTRWEFVLEKLGIEKSEKTLNSDFLNSRGLYNPYGSEGSPEHKALRDYIAINPKILCIEEDVTGIPEYPLKSGDSVDVVFDTTSKIYAIEVKSIRSGEDDIERGLYQCIKYKAVIEQELKVNGLQKATASILVLQGLLPHRLKRIKNILDILVLQNISPDDLNE